MTGSSLEPADVHELYEAIEAVESRPDKRYFARCSFKNAAKGVAMYELLQGGDCKPAAQGVVSFGGGEAVLLQFAAFYLLPAYAAIFPFSRRRSIDLDPELPDDPKLPYHKGHAFTFGNKRCFVIGGVFACYALVHFIATTACAFNKSDMVKQIGDDNDTSIGVGFLVCLAVVGIAASIVGRLPKGYGTFFLLRLINISENFGSLFYLNVFAMKAQDHPHCLEGPFGLQALYLIPTILYALTMTIEAIVVTQLHGPPRAKFMLYVDAFQLFLDVCILLLSNSYFTKKAVVPSIIAFVVKFLVGVVTNEELQEWLVDRVERSAGAGIARAREASDGRAVRDHYSLMP